MPSVTGCRTLSTPIREAIPNISDRKTSPYTFARSFNGARPEEKTVDRSKKLLEIFQDYSQNVNAVTSIKKISRRKTECLVIDKNFRTFSPNLDTRKPDQVQIQAASRCLPRVFFANRKIKTFTPKQSPGQLFPEKAKVQTEVNDQSSLLVSAMTGFIAFFLISTNFCDD